MLFRSKRSLDVGDGEKVRDTDPVLRRHLIALLLDLYLGHGRLQFGRYPDITKQVQAKTMELSVSIERRGQATIRRYGAILKADQFRRGSSAALVADTNYRGPHVPTRACAYLYSMCHEPSQVSGGGFWLKFATRASNAIEGPSPGNASSAAENAARASSQLRAR